MTSACAHRYASLQREFAAEIARIQARIGGRVGAYMLDTQSQLELAFNARERFAMCSTFKERSRSMTGCRCGRKT
jgi:beta-lactamase class A